MMGCNRIYYKDNRKAKQTKQKRTTKQQSKSERQSGTMASLIIAFLMCMILNIIATLVCVWVVSFFYKPPDNYVNNYRIVPREEHENYKRYERQEYLDSLRRPRK